MYYVYLHAVYLLDPCGNVKRQPGTSVRQCHLRSSSCAQSRAACRPHFRIPNPPVLEIFYAYRHDPTSKPVTKCDH